MSIYIALDEALKFQFRSFFVLHHQHPSDTATRRNQIHLKHLFRDRYIRETPSGDELRADQPYPWTSGTLFWLEQPSMTPSAPFSAAGPVASSGRASAGSSGSTSKTATVARLGRVALRTQSGRYLRPADGSLVETIDDPVLMSMELKPGELFAFSIIIVHFRAYSAVTRTGSKHGLLEVSFSRHVVFKKICTLPVKVSFTNI
ncbi:unnamed protein product [Protopolystoma xenopodis]|uniref:Uncharacterized protein n=1 Tax=Protopolystoma xenopodis TaxID=117903 RepID=A0A3S5FC98_9PLAT|nr:unnamed protein product [Protopolystoma xenopodis]